MAYIDFCSLFLSSELFQWLYDRAAGSMEKKSGDLNISSHALIKVTMVKKFFLGGKHTHNSTFLTQKFLPFLHCKKQKTTQTYSA